ncbi:MAG: alkaline phosphatase family protein [Chitinophagaceae bacterium]|nr:alkaline phosphatase family protein [Chitinophagaceae bacterium]
MRKLIAILALVLVAAQSFAQSKKGQPNVPNRPKLVVGIVVDQMRWDYLYRYYDRYTEKGGFKRLLNKGFTCENTFIPYTPTYTACGHTCVYTGSVPAIHGITGNNWYDNELKRVVYCAEDKSVKSVGTTTDAGLMSPKNMLATTIADELKLATNFRSKVVGVAIKDRGAILPAGHAANGAYWYDSKTGDFITSTFYMNDLPQWVKDFNAQKLVDKYYAQGWNLLYPANTYVQSTADEKSYESKPLGADQKGFPYDLNRFVGKNYGSVASTPYGNSLTAEMAKAAVTNEQLGADNITDFLAVSFSSPDYIGHAFGPNSMEVEDNYLRLDQELGSFFDFLDAKVGKGEYLLFISADHGVSHVPGFNIENRLPGGTVDDGKWIKELEPQLQAAFGSSRLITGSWNNIITLNHGLIDSMKLDEKAVKKLIVDYLSHQNGVSRAFALDDLNTIPLNETIRTRINNGYYPRRCGDIQFVLQPAYFDGGATGTTHGLWNPYDSHIPLVFYGWGIKTGKTNRETYMTDIAATIAAMLRIQMPSGCVGHAITEVSE